MTLTLPRAVVMILVVVALCFTVATAVVYWGVPHNKLQEMSTVELLDALESKGIIVLNRDNHIEQLKANGCVMMFELTIVSCGPDNNWSEDLGLSAKRSMSTMTHFEQVRGLVFYQQLLGSELERLVEFNKLKRLYLRGCEVNLSSWSFLGRCEALEELVIPTNNLTDDDLATFELPASLRTLDLSFNDDVTHRGIRSLSPVESVSKLSVAATSVSNLEFVQRMRGLTELDAMGTAIENEDLDPLVALPKLRVLNIVGTNITDEAIDIILEMNALRHLNLTSTGVSTDSIDRLKDRRPNLEILLPSGIAE